MEDDLHEKFFHLSYDKGENQAMRFSIDPSQLNSQVVACREKEEMVHLVKSSKGPRGP